MKTYTLTEAEFDQINNADTELRAVVDILRSSGETLFAEMLKRKLNAQMSALHAAKDRPVADQPTEALKRVRNTLMTAAMQSGERDFQSDYAAAADAWHQCINEAIDQINEALK